jgi:Domain of unknown function (DUF6134)
MRLMAGLIAGMVLGTGSYASAETIKFAILRNDDQIGTHTIEINRAGPETSVKVVTDLTVTVLFVTAYRLTHSATEKWLEGRLVSMSSTTNNNGTRHAVSVAETPSGMEIKADGKVTRENRPLMPGSLWNQELMRQKVMIDSQEGNILPLSVVDHGTQQLTVKSRPVKAHKYTLKSKYTQDVWYDEQGRLVHARLVASDGSIILYRLL